jgi:RNA polymerase sigma factor (sigma-70 family)
MALSFSLQAPISSRFCDEPETSNTEEACLIERSQAGEMQAFNLLVERYQHRVYALSFRMLNDADAAEDATQEVFLAAWRGIRRFRGGSFVAWLLRIASNECFDVLRARRRRPSISLDATGEDEDVAPLQLADPGESPDERALRNELALEIQQQLQELSADNRLVLTLSDIQGYSYDEIVAVTGWPLGTVKSRLSRARAQLRGTLRLAELLATTRTS